MVSEDLRNMLASPEERPEDGGYHLHKVVYSDIDYNGHCNSCKYLEFMLNVCEPVELKKGLPPQVSGASADNTLRIDIKYAKEIHRGDKVDIFYKKQPDEINYEIRTSEGEVSCQARIAKQQGEQ